MRLKLRDAIVAVAVLSLSLIAGAQNTFPSSGNVGIGTTTPQTLLHLYSGSMYGTRLFLSNTNDTAGQDFSINVGGTTSGGGNPSNILGFWTTNTNGTLSDNVMTLTGALNVGIGTLAPQGKFHISDVAKAFNSTQNEFDSNFELQGTYSGKAIGQGPALGFVAPANTDGTNPWEMARILVSPDTTGSSDAHGRMYLQTRGLSGSTWTWNNNLLLTSNGNVQLGGNLILPQNTGASITFQDGSVQTIAYTGNCGGDYAESIDVTGDRRSFSPGDVLVIDPVNPGKFLKSADAYSTSVTGIYSTKPGVVGRRQLTPKNADEVPMAMIGIVPTKVSAENGPIQPGDLLVTSSTIGYAMRGTDRGRMLGAVIGKALGNLETGTGVIEVVVTLQ